jgi:hypothetical protein
MYQINQMNQMNQSSDNMKSTKTNNNATIARNGQLKANKIHFQLSIFN